MPDPPDDDPPDIDALIRDKLPPGTPHPDQFRDAQGRIDWAAWRRVVDERRRQAREQRKRGFGSNGEIPQGGNAET